MTIGTRLYTWWKGEEVGKDRFGNRYFREKGGARRWVLYDGEAEASKVPAEWHAWLHKTVDRVPSENSAFAQSWEKPHEANATGSAEAYHPPGSLHEGARRAKATGDYEPWRPS